MNIKYSFILLLTLACATADATNIVIHYDDKPNIGFNDITPRKSTVDNPATTVGDARKYVLEQTTEMFSTQFKMTSDIFWKVSFSELNDFGAITIGPVSREMTFGDTLDSFDILELGRSYPNIFLYAVTGIVNPLTGRDSYGIDDQDAETLFSPNYENFTFSLIDGKHRLSSVILHELVHVIGFSGGDCLGDCLGAVSRKNIFSKYVYVADTINGQWDDLSIPEKERVGILENQVTFKSSQALNDYAQNNLSSGFNEHGIELHSSPESDGSWDNQSISHLSANVLPEQLMHSAGKDVMELGVAAYMLCDIGWCRDNGFVTDLEITQNVSVPIAPNVESPFTFEITNLGNKTVSDSIVELTFPNESVINESMLDSNCLLTNAVVTCSYDELISNNYVDITVYATINELNVYAIKSKIYSNSYIVDSNGMNNLLITPLIVQIRDFPSIILDSSSEIISESPVSIAPTFTAVDDENLSFAWSTDENIDFTQDTLTGELSFIAPKVSFAKTLSFSLTASSNGRTLAQSISIKVNPLAKDEVDEGSSGGSINFFMLLGLLLFVIKNDKPAACMRANKLSEQE
jgi:hypothetical protein